MLQHLQLTNFKSFVDERAAIAPFTLLVGANASGKSNFVDALRFLHGMAQGWPVRDVVSGRTEASTKVWSGIRGGSRDLVRSGQQSCSITSHWQILGDAYEHTIQTDGLTIRKESIANLFAARQIAGSMDPNRGLGIEWLPGSMHPSSEVGPVDRSVICQPSAVSNAFVSPFRHTLASMMHFFEPVPDLMREYVEKPAPGGRQALDSGSISGLLWSLCQDPRRKQELVDWLVEFCAPEIADIGFEETESGYVLLRVTEKDGTRITAKSMSDGTLRFLALLAAIRSGGDVGTTLVIEDLEHGLHPSRLQLLVQAIESATRWMPEKGPAHEAPVVIATTHSPVLLEAALEIPEASVLLFARSPEAEGTIIRDVRSLPHFDEVKKRRDFTYLLNTGWLERAV